MEKYLNLFDITNNNFASRWTGACIGWTPELVIAHVIADLVISLVCFCIAGILLWIFIKRNDIPFNFIFVVFSIFILSCGSTHLSGAITSFMPYYYADFWLKAFTVAASLFAVVVLLYHFKDIINIPSPFSALQNLDKTNKELKRVNASLEQFVYVASHDLKAPLRGIANLCTWIEEDGFNVEHFAKIKSRITNMQGLIDGLLEYSRIGKTYLEKKEVNVSALLDSLEYDVVIEGKIPIINQANDFRLRQIFINLIDNAFKHHHDPENAYVTVQCKEEKQRFVFCVADNGPGIAEKYHSKIFTIFHTVNPSSDVSSGVGLAIVKRIVEEDCGGELWVDSGIGRGSKFYFSVKKNE